MNEERSLHKKIIHHQKNAHQKTHHHHQKKELHQKAHNHLHQKTLNFYGRLASAKIYGVLLNVLDKCIDGELLTGNHIECMEGFIPETTYNVKLYFYVFYILIFVCFHSFFIRKKRQTISQI